MSKRLTHETTYRERSASFSTHGSKRGVNLLGWDAVNEEWLSADQEREALKARLQQLQALFTRAKTDRRLLSDEQRVTLGAEQCRLQTRMNEIRPKLQGFWRGLEIFLVCELQKIVPPRDYEAAMQRAKKDWKAYHDERIASGGMAPPGWKE